MTLLEGITVSLGLGALALVAAEAVARFYLRRGRPMVNVPRLRQRLLLHPDAAPGLTRRVVRYDVNSLGERGAEPRPDGNPYRVLFVGGSAAECRLLDQPLSLGERIRAHLSSPEALTALGRDHVQFGALARSLVDTEGLRVILESIKPHCRPYDVLLLMSGMSDLMRWLGIGGQPGSLPDSMTIGELLMTYPGKRFTWRQPALKPVLARLRAAWPGYVNVREHVAKNIAQEAAARGRVTEFPPLASDPSAVLERLERHMGRLIEVAHELAARVVVVRQPWFHKDRYTPEEERCLWSGRIGSASAPGAPRFLSHAELHRYSGLIDEAVVRTAGRLKVETINLQPFLPPRLGVYYDHYHLGEEGADLAAAAIERVLLRH